MCAESSLEQRRVLIEIWMLNRTELEIQLKLIEINGRARFLPVRIKPSCYGAGLGVGELYQTDTNQIRKKKIKTEHNSEKYIFSLIF